MAKGMYVGVSGVARKAKKMYIGVGGVAKKIKKIYVGDANGKARLSFQGGSGVDPTKSSFTEAEFLSVIEDGNQSLMQIGATITLSNTYCSTYEVIGTNHDGTTGTVDIMAHTQVGNQQFSASSDKTYSSSPIYTWINGTYFNAFSSNIRNVAKTMSVVTNTGSGNTTTSDKVKLLSMTEIGATNTYSPTGEGSLYTSVFTPGDAFTQISNRWRDKGTYGNANYYWLRSRNSSTIKAVWVVKANGACDNGGYGGLNYTLGILPVLRF